MAANPKASRPISPEWDLVLALGGPAKVAELLRDEKGCSVQRVQNWKHRGIPLKVKLKHPKLFLPHGVKALVKEMA